MALSRQEFVDLALAQIDAVDRVARTLTRNAASADDLVQDTYLNALKAHGSFQLQAFGIRPWLLRILHNLHLNRVKREKRQPASVADEHLEAAGAVPSGDPPNPAEPFPWEGNVIEDEQLRAALEQLPQELQTIVTMWAVDELSCREIAHVMEIPIGTVMSRLHRARQKLAVLLADHPVAAAKRRNEAANGIADC